jgi:tetratricopeptide (TPR) repeat protein
MLEDEIKAHNDAQSSKRDYRMVAFIFAFAIVFGLLWLFLASTNQNTSTSQDEALSQMDQNLAGKLKPLLAQLKEHPEDDVAMTKIGYLYLQAGASRESIKNFKSAEAVNPDNVAALIGLSTAYQFTGRNEEAGPLIDRALKINPDYVPAKINKAHLLADQNRDQEALDLLHDAEASCTDPQSKSTITRTIAEIQNKSAK